jgi:O-acetylhomoserine (thiol)-lyase
VKLETLAIHSGYTSEETSKALATPIYQTAAYEFDSADHAAALFDLEAEGFRYSRISNPTTAVLEERVAQMEGGVGALAVSSGQAALHFALANVCHGAGEIVATPQLYGTTHGLLSHILPAQGITARFAAGDRPEDIEAQINADTRAVFCESIGNPAGNLCDIEAIAKVAHVHGLPLIVDNTVATPLLLRPAEHGADIIVHSLTKYLGGHGTTMGGMVVDVGRFDWMAGAARFAQFTTPDVSYQGLVYAERFGATAFTARCRSVYQRATGAILAPMSAFLLLQGIETAALRIERHVENARKVAQFLRGDPRAAWVNYAGFPDSPYYALAQKYLGGSVPSLLTFGVRGGYEAGKDFFDALGMIRRLVNIGDAKSLACHPASTTHRQMPQAQQLKAGVTPEAIRLSIGIEHIDDILADLDQALAAAAHQSAAAARNTTPGTPRLKAVGA